jgi:hypothetical protein
MPRVITYIDGFNLYHAVDDLKDQSLKWLDLWALSASLLRLRLGAGLAGCPST